MIEWRQKINDSQGLHARPAVMLAAAAGKFHSRITGECQGLKANLKDAVEILGLNADYNCEIFIKVEGHDEAEAFHAIQEVLKKF